jgi:hypothetical protein
VSPCHEQSLTRRAVPDIVDKSSPPIAKHRVNAGRFLMAVDDFNSWGAALNALLRSKHVLRIANKGLLYKLDPVRHPPAVSR